MIKKAMIAFTLVAMSNLMLAGCTRTVRCSLYESGHLRHNAIMGVVLKTGEREAFNERGGRFNTRSKVVSGLAPDGDSSGYKLGELSQVKTIARASGLALALDVPTRFFPGYYKNQKPGKITYVLTRDGLRHVFDSRGGSIDIATGALAGYDKFKTPVSVALEDVDLVGVKKPDKVANTLLFVGVAAAITIGVVALVLHDMNFNLFGDSTAR